MEAEVSIHCTGELFEFVNANKNDLKDVLIVSVLKVFDDSQGEYKAENMDGLSVSINHSKYEKCERCWTYSETVGKDISNPTICERCSNVLK